MRRVVLLLVLSARLAWGVETDFTAPGPFPVGYTEIDLTTSSVTTGEPRLLHTLVWYPAVEGTGKATGALLTDADVARGRFPFVAFSHGSCGTPNQSPFLMTALASRGMIIAAPPHPGNTFIANFSCMQPDHIADAFQNRPADIRFVIDAFLAFGRDKSSRFFRHVHPKRIGISGHSFGGQTTLRVAAADRRIRAALALAPASPPSDLPPIKAPLMVMTGEIDSLTPFETDARPAYALGRGPRFLIEILNAGHCAFIPGCITLVCGAGCEPTNLPTPQANALVVRYGVPFLERYLAGLRSVTKLLQPAAAPSGIVVETAKPGR